MLEQVDIYEYSSFPVSTFASFLFPTRFLCVRMSLFSSREWRGAARNETLSLSMFSDTFENLVGEFCRLLLHRK